MRAQRLLLFTMIAALAAGAPLARAEIKGPGHYRGMYRVDRWGQHRFSFLFVDPALAPEMVAFTEKPHELHCIEVDQWMNPGGAMIKAIGDAQPLPKPLDVSLAWVNADGALRRTDVERGATLLVTVTPTDELYGTILSRVGFRLWIDSHTVGADGEIQFVTGNGHETYNSDKPGVALSYASVNARIGVDDATISPALMLADPRVAAFKDDDSRLADGAAHTFEIRLAELPANEYEIGVSYTFMPPPPPDTVQPRTVSVSSNTLRLDVLADEPLAAEGVEVRLRDATPPKLLEGRLSLEAVFRNTSERTVAFHVSKTEDPLAVNGSLFTYDAAGTLLRTVPEEGVERPDVFLLHTDRIVLAPGETYVMKTTAPRATATARVAYMHRWSTREEHAGVHDLSHVWLVSQTLILGR